MKRSLADLREEMRAVAKGERDPSPLPPWNDQQRLTGDEFWRVMAAQNPRLPSRKDRLTLEQLRRVMGWGAPSWVESGRSPSLLEDNPTPKGTP